LNSKNQFVIVDDGAQIRKGPLTLASINLQITAMHCTDFPNPISSAKIPFSPFSNKIFKTQNKD